MRTWVSRLTTAASSDPLLAVVAERWVAQRDPDVVARRAAIVTALNHERAAVEALDDDYYVRRRISEDRYRRLSESLTTRIERLQRVLAEHPLPEAAISALLDPVLAGEAWKKATVKEQRDLLRLALLEVRVSQGVRGQRFDAATRLTFVWATTPPTITGAAGEDQAPYLAAEWSCDALVGVP